MLTLKIDTKNSIIHKADYLAVVNPGNARLNDNVLELAGAAVDFCIAITAYKKTTEKGPSASVSYSSVRGISIFGRLDNFRTFLLETDKYQVLKIGQFMMISIPVIIDGNVVTGQLFLEMLEDGLRISWNY